jgi:hypothetical protein
MKHAFVAAQLLDYTIVSSNFGVHGSSLKHVESYSSHTAGALCSLCAEQYLRKTYMPLSHNS